MLIVIVIIGILAWALIPRIGTARDKANDTAREANVRSLATAMVQYGLDHGSYPDKIRDNKGGWRLENYGITESFDGQPTDNDYYEYIQLDGGSHFVFYTQLSEWSEAWNCNIDIRCFKIDGGERLDVPLNECQSNHGAVRSKIIRYKNEWEDALEGDDMQKYSVRNTEVIRTSWKAFCYLQ